MNPYGFRKSVLASLTVLVLVAALLPLGRQATDIQPAPDYIIGQDMIVSYDELENSNDALHPSVAVTPVGNEYVGTIHVVWDEFDEVSGYREIHYSSSEDEGMTWSHDHDDFMVSNNRKNKANNGNAVNPSVAVDQLGRVHVIWTEQMQADGTWEVFYSYSADNGKTWSGISADIRISQIVGNRNDALFISSPRLVIGTPPDKAAPVFHAIWSEMSEKQDQELIHYSRSTNGGASWSGQEADDILSMPGEFARDPDIAYSGAEANFIHLSWTQEGPDGWDEIFYRMSDDFGNKGTWKEVKPISCLRDDGMIACDVTFAGGPYDDVHAVWKQYPYDKAPEIKLYYSSSKDNGQSWNGVEDDLPICDFDGNEPSDPCVGVGDRRVQVMWAEIDEKSPLKTMEIHTSWTDDPTNPGKWSGLGGDIVLSNGDEWGPANAMNVSMEMGFMKSGYWKPVFVWDELNDEPTKDRADRSNEIHTEPLPEWTLSVTVSGSGSVAKSPNQATYTDGTWVTLTANPSLGWSFDHWGGDLFSYSNPDSIYMDDDKSVTAYFTQDQYTLTVNTYGSGSVARSPDQATYTYGQIVTLTATPTVFGWRFDHWSGAISGSVNPSSVTMTSSKTVNAYFYQNIYYRNLTIGWNLVSLPYIQGNTSAAAVLSSISGSYDSVKYFNTQDKADPWKSYRPAGTHNDLLAINHRMALWVHATSACTLTVYGDIPASTAIPLYTGWNFVGYPSATPRLASVTLPGVADIVSVWNAASPYYITDYLDKSLVTMSQGNGYWVHVTSDTTWTVNW